MTSYLVHYHGMKPEKMASHTFHSTPDCLWPVIKREKYDEFFIPGINLAGKHVRINDDTLVSHVLVTNGHFYGPPKNVLATNHARNPFSRGVGMMNSIFQLPLLYSYGSGRKLYAGLIIRACFFSSSVQNVAECQLVLSTARTNIMALYFYLRLKERTQFQIAQGGSFFDTGWKRGRGLLVTLLAETETDLLMPPLLRPFGKR